MLFNSLPFLLFLPSVFAGYWLLRKHLFVQNLFVVAASYVFYGWWNPRFLLLIGFTSLWSYFSGLVIARHFDRRAVVRTVLAAALVVNLGILGVFKYYDFFLENFVTLLRAIGFDPHPTTLGIILPVGISFYTFQALSYVIDVARGTLRATKDPVAFLAFVSFFPQLVAGPIERATNLLPQFLRPRAFDYAEAVDGMRQMLWGFLKKTVVADNCAVLVNAIFNGAESPSGAGVVLGTFAFTLQIYGDFSGYSDIAIGCSKLFGIKLMRNFAFPYFSHNIAEFWRRWHISLNTWFRDYLYIPLGGSRGEMWKKTRNIFVIFLVSGLWHGANWTFVLWGAYHAALFLPLLLLRRNRSDEGGVLSAVTTFLLVMFGWLIFRAPDLSTLRTWIGSLFSSNFTTGLADLPVSSVPWLIVAGMFLVEFVNRDREHALARLPRNAVLRWTLYFALLTIVLYFRGGQTDFIYFQF